MIKERFLVLFMFSGDLQTDPTIIVINEYPFRFDNVTFICNYSQIEDNLPIEWKFDETNLLGKNETTLVITNVTDEVDSGTYSCIVNNSTANVTIKVSDFCK